MRTCSLRCGVALKGLLCLGLVGLVLSVPAQAVPTITLGPGVTNPATNLTSTVPETAVPDTETLVPVASFLPILQATLTTQGFTVANNWLVNTSAVVLANNATFNITTNNLFLNGAGTKFGETNSFNLSPNLAGPASVGGSSNSIHWLQILNESQQFGGFGYAISGFQGFYQLDNGDKPGGLAAGPLTGPYYNSNPPPFGFSIPPGFFDGPNFYAGVGTYLHFDAIPVWDVYTPAAGLNPATDTIDVGNYGLSWGFTIVPEPSSVILTAVGLLGLVSCLRRRRT
jgi:hypothetical protein